MQLDFKAANLSVTRNLKLSGTALITMIFGFKKTHLIGLVALTTRETESKL